MNVGKTVGIVAGLVVIAALGPFAVNNVLAYKRDRDDTEYLIKNVSSWADDNNVRGYCNSAGMAGPMFDGCVEGGKQGRDTYMRIYSQRTDASLPKLLACFRAGMVTPGMVGHNWQLSGACVIS